MPPDHYLTVTVKDTKFRDALDQLVALRNFAAHESPASKKKVLEALKIQKIGSAGAWVKRQDRFPKLAGRLTDLADAISDAAPY